MRAKQYPFLLTKVFLLKEYGDVLRGIGCFPGAPYHIETDPELPLVQLAPSRFLYSYSKHTYKD